MAQRHKGRRVGNTKNSSYNKTRNWCFTLNNYSKIELEQLYNLKNLKNLKQYCFQEEKGENKIPHLQGVLAYKNAICFNSMKKLSPRANWSQCEDLKKSLAYCCKERTRCGHTYTHNYEIFNGGKPLTKLDINNELLRQALESIDEIDLTNIKL